MTPISKNTGFVLLYAVLVASVISITGVLLSDIIFKQLVLSSIGKESQFAYYAATAGDECALYWNTQLAFGRLKGPCPDNGAGKQCEYIDTTISPIQCNGQDIIVTPQTDLDNNGVFPKRFEFKILNLQNSSCAIVTVTKDRTQKKSTLFQSQGYNRGGVNCNDPSPRRIEKIIFRSPF